MGYPAYIPFPLLRVPISVDNFDNRWWLLHSPKPAHPHHVVHFSTAWKTVLTEYINATGRRRRDVVEYVLVLPNQVRDLDQMKSWLAYWCLQIIGA